MPRLLDAMQNVLLLGSVIMFAMTVPFSFSRVYHKEQNLLRQTTEWQQEFRLLKENERPTQKERERTTAAVAALHHIVELQNEVGFSRNDLWVLTLAYTC